MENKFKKKLQLSKTVVANLSKQEMEQATGGLPVSAGYTCGTACRSQGFRCAAEYSDLQRRNDPRGVSLQRCDISLNPRPGQENVTCGIGQYCGSDTNQTCLC